MKEIITKPAGKNLQAQNEDHTGPVVGYRGGGSFSEQPGGGSRGLPLHCQGTMSSVYWLSNIFSGSKHSSAEGGVGRRQGGNP